MLKVFLLLIFFSLFALVLPNYTEYVSAQERCSFQCPSGTAQIGADKCASSPTSTDVKSLEAKCPANKTPSDPNDTNNCICNPNQTPAAPAPVQAPPAPVRAPGTTNNTTPTTNTTNNTTSPGCTGSNCTSGAGRACRLSDGQPTAVAGPNTGILTAIGCIPTEPKLLIETLLRVLSVGAGGIAFLLMILSALSMITAEGNPEIIKHSQERFYSAIIGLLVIIFSVLLMQVIGVDLLSLPGFGRRGGTPP